jgi:hypothetical protein
MTDEDVDLYRTPAEVLRRERDHLKQRLKEERAELQRFVELETGRNEALAGLVDAASKDVRATEALLATYRDAIAKVR